MRTMKAVVFHGIDRLQIEDRPRPSPGPGQAVIRITTTSVCPTDVRMVRGDYHVPRGLVLGHEPVGLIEELGEGLHAEYQIGQRVLVGAVTPCGQCYDCLNGSTSQCGGPGGGWRFGRTIDGAWAEYLLVPHAAANLAPIPPELSDDEVLLVPHIFSAGLAGVEAAGVQVGDAVAVFAQGPTGLCATIGAVLRGAALVIAVDAVPSRLLLARRFGANVTVNFHEQDPLEVIRRLTGGRGVDVAVEALGEQASFETALRAVRPGGTLSSLGLYAGKLVAPTETLVGGIGDKRIVTTLCPGGKERMRRLLALVAARRVDLTALTTHHFALDDVGEAIDLVADRRDDVLKVALHPAVRRRDRQLEPPRVPPPDDGA